MAPGRVLTGPLFSEPMRVETVIATGPTTWVVGLVGVQSERFRKVTLTVGDLERLAVLDTQHSRRNGGIPFTQAPTTGCGGVSSSGHGYP